MQRKCNAGRGIDRLFLPSRDDEMLFRGPTMGRGNNKQEKQKKRKKRKREKREREKEEEKVEEVVREQWRERERKKEIYSIKCMR